MDASSVKHIRTRFAPSPTGVLHLGSIRTALFCWLYARRFDGVFVLRIEDTDRARSTEANVQAILEGMGWLGLTADEGPIFQTDRFARYDEVLKQWLADGKAYHCYCSKEELDQRREQQMANGEKPRYDGRCRNRKGPVSGIDPVVRFRNPLDGEVIVQDQVRGRVAFQNAELDDLIIARSDGSPTYNFTVVVDDHDMNITHVIRGDDHLNNTPRQLNMFAALGVTPPSYAHLPMILGADGAKLSKRHGAVDIREYKQQGYLPEAMLNYLVRLGWSHGDQEIFSIDEMTRLFDVADVNQSASAFNAEKLLWINQQHIKEMPAEELGRRFADALRRRGIEINAGPAPKLVADALRERAETLEKMVDSAEYFYEDFQDLDAGAAKKHLRPVILEPLEAVAAAFEQLDDWSASALSATLNSVAERFEINMGKLGQPVRVAVTGSSMSPSIDITLELIGRERVLDRVGKALEFIRARAAK